MWRSALAMTILVLTSMAATPLLVRPLAEPRDEASATPSREALPACTAGASAAIVAR